ncbi:MAG: type B 50S ribosomal protein L31 [Patescibacteria group bacterium]
MKSDIHPKNYRTVVFQDAGSGAQFLIGSTVETTQTTKVDGKEYPLCMIEISSASHPFYTGKSTTIDRAGRVDRFKKRTAARATKAKKN